METTNFKELMRYIRSKFYIVVIIFALVVTAGEIYTNVLQTPLYSSSTEVVLLNEGNTTLTTQDVLLSNNLINTYAEIVKSRNVLGQVVENLNLDLTTEDLAKKVAVSPTTSTQLLTIKVSDESAEQAQKIADQIAATFKQEIKNIYNIDNIQIVDQASLPTTPYNVNLLRATLIYVALGLVLGLGATIALYFLDTTIKDSQTVEEHTSLTVIGVIPNVTK